jgi:UDP-N-acetylmuramate dehydrogenase
MKNEIFQKNVSLKNYTTYKVGGFAKYFLIVRTKDDLIKAVKLAKELKLPIFILGGGSNVLISDKGFKGLVIKIENPKIDICDQNFVYAEAGVHSAKLVKFTTDNSLSGIEWFAGIPGTIGGAIYGNAQAFGVKMSDSVESVEVLDLKKAKIINLSKEQCGFSLKKSIFKKNKNLIIVSAVLKLDKAEKEDIEKKVKEYLSYRKKSHPIKFCSAGSVFVNPEMTISNKKLLEKFPKLMEFNEWGVVHVGYLIESCGLKGKKIGNAQISIQHANFIVNLGGARSKDVLALINLAKQEVKKTFGISLITEIQFVGF